MDLGADEHVALDAAKWLPLAKMSDGRYMFGLRPPKAAWLCKGTLQPIPGGTRWRAFVTKVDGQDVAAIFNDIDTAARWCERVYRLEYGA